MSALKDSIIRRLSPYEEQDGFLLDSALDPLLKLKWYTNTEYSTIIVNLTNKVKLIAKQDAPVFLNLEPQPTTESTTNSTKGFLTHQWKVLIQPQPTYLLSQLNL